jgi:hypothetical protein
VVGPVTTLVCEWLPGSNLAIERTQDRIRVVDQS